MRAGIMRHRITIQEQQRAPNAIGEMVTTWADWQTVWGSIEPNTGKRYYEALQANAEVDGIIRTRYLKGVSPTMRIIYGSRVLSIVSILNVQERRKELRIYYREARD